MTSASLPVSVFSDLPFFNNVADIISFRKPGTVSLPSFGQSNTERYSVVEFAPSFFVQRPQVNKPKGLALVSYTASPFTFIHAPISFNKSTLSFGNVPSAFGPTFNK